MRVIADIDKCIGAGTCVRVAGGVFSQDEDTGLVEILIDSPEDGDRVAVGSAIKLCPTHALTLED